MIGSARSCTKSSSFCLARPASGTSCSPRLRITSSAAESWPLPPSTMTRSGRRPPALELRVASSSIAHHRERRRDGARGSLTDGRQLRSSPSRSVFASVALRSASDSPGRVAVVLPALEAAAEDLGHRGEVVGADDRLDPEAAVLLRSRLAVDEHDHAGDRAGALDVRVVVALDAPRVGRAGSALPGAASAPASRFSVSASQRTRSMSSDSRAFSVASSTMRRRLPRWATAICDLRAALLRQPLLDQRRLRHGERARRRASARRWRDS